MVQYPLIFSKDIKTVNLKRWCAALLSLLLLPLGGCGEKQTAQAIQLQPVVETVAADVHRVVEKLREIGALQ